MSNCVERIRLNILALSAVCLALVLPAAALAGPDLPTEGDVKVALGDLPVTPGNLDTFAQGLSRLLPTATTPQDHLRYLALAGIAWQMAGESERARNLFEYAVAQFPHVDGLYSRLAAVAPTGTWIYVGGWRVRFTDATPYVREGAIMAPMRDLALVMGAWGGWGEEEAWWNPESRTAEFRFGGHRVQLAARDGRAIIDGREVRLGVAPEIAAPGRIMVPVRELAEHLGYRVTVHIGRPGVVVMAIRQAD